MNDDDDFGDLYAADVGGGGVGTGTLYEVTKEVREERRRFGEVEDEREDEEELLYGSSSSSAVAAAAPGAVAVPLPAAGVGLTTGFEVGGKEVENEETFLYGELYGSAPAATTTTGRSDDDDDDGARKGALQSESAAVIGNENLYSAEVGGSVGLSGLENPRGVGQSPGVGLLPQVVAPGLAPSPSFGLRGKEEVASAAVRGDGNGVRAAEGAEEDWDSDSDDGLQIVLNDDAPAYDNTEGDGKGEFYDDDEDEEDLIIVAGDEPLDGQEDWGEEGGPLSEPPLPGPPSGGPPGAAERILPGVNSSLELLLLNG